MTPDQKDKLQAIKNAARSGKVIIASRDKVETIEEGRIQRVLKAIAEVAGKPGMARAFVTDLSKVGDFFVCRHHCYPPCDEKCVCDFSGEEARLSEMLGSPVTLGDYIHELAGRNEGVG
jgi:hypothetical protein